MKPIGDLIFLWSFKLAKVAAWILLLGAAIFLFGFFARVGFRYGVETDHAFFLALLVGVGLAVLSIIVYVCCQLYNMPEVFGPVGGVAVGLAVGGMIVGIGFGGQWGLPAKIFGVAMGLLVAIAPIVFAGRQKAKR